MNKKESIFDVILALHKLSQEAIRLDKAIKDEEIAKSAGDKAVPKTDKKTKDE